MQVSGTRLDLSPKYLPPQITGLQRGRLLDIAAHRVGLVLAPAGHGKTTLLGQVAARFDGAVAWYRIDAADRDPVGLAGRIGRVLCKVAGADRPPAAFTSFDEVAAAADRLPATRDTMLVLDDFHAIADSESESGLARLIALAPPTLRVLLGARRVSGLDVAALRLSGGVRVLGADDLRFRSWEVERLFRDEYHQPLRPEDAATLTRRTEGWAAGLAMFHLLTEGRPPTARRRALDDLARGSRLVRSYLVREVLGELPPELRDFLRRTSALGVLTGALCDELLGTTGSQAVLEGLEQRRLFTTTHDDGRHFGYHQVLLDHLELELTEHLGPVPTRQWYGRAAEVLLAAGEVPAAFRAYARAEDWSAVEDLLARRGAEIVADPPDPRDGLLPVGLHAQDPWLLLARARRLVADGALAEAVRTFRLAQSVAEDAHLAARCLEEARAAALWLPGADPVLRTWTGVVRAATQRNPRQLMPAAAELPGAEGRLAAGVVALLAGDLAGAATALRLACTHPDADFRIVALATCATALIRVLAPVDTADPWSDLEIVLLDAEIGGWPWLSRTGRALLTTDDPPAVAADDADPWGRSLTLLVDGVRRRAPGPLRAAAEGFAALGAPVPAQWALCLAAAAEASPDGTARDEAGLRARSMGLRDVLPVVEAWAGRRRVAAVRSGAVPAPRTEQPPVELRLFGRLEITVDGRPVDLSALRPRARSALRLLALRAGDTVHRDALAAGLWPDLDEDSALRSVQVAVSSLRSALGRPGLLVRSGASYGLALPPAGRCDVHDFEGLLGLARTRRGTGDRAGERTALRAALDLHRGELLADEGVAEWVVADRDRLRLAAAAGWLALARCLGDDGEFTDAVDAARTCLRWDPYADAAWRLLVELHTRAGNPAAARAAAREHEHLVAELGQPAEA